MNVIVVAVDVGKCPVLLHCSFLTKQKEPLAKWFWIKPDFTKSWTSDRDKRRPSYVPPRFSHQTFPFVHFFLPTSFHHIFKRQSVLPFSHYSISSPPTALKASLTLSTRVLLTLHVPCFHHSILAPFPSFHLALALGRMQH